MVPLLLGAVAIVGIYKLVEEYMFERQKVYVAFDYENDKHYKHMLTAWDANREFDFRFNDSSSGEVQTADVGRVKAALTCKIGESDVVLAIVGAEANKPHRDRRLIGYLNWINFEIARGREARKRIVAVKLDRRFESPEQLQGANASWALAFTRDTIVKALRS